MHGKISSSEEGFERAHTIKFNRYISARDFVQFISIRFPSPILAYNCIVPSSGLSGFRQSSLFLFFFGQCCARCNNSGSHGVMLK